MPGAKYEQLSVKPDTEEDVFTSKPKGKWSEICVQNSLLSLGLILLYFSLSIGLTFYQRWLLKEFHYPLTVVMYHLIVKWLLSVIIRIVLCLVTGVPQLLLSFPVCLKSVGPTGLASGIDVGFSNWGLELVTISLYTMTKSTTIIFILGFAILLGLEKKSWSLVGIVLMIATGLVMFTYKATQFNLLGFNFLLIASFAAGLRWTFAQLLMQKSRLGLHNPVDMVFHVQPWMFLSLLPFTIIFEGFECFEHLRESPPEEFLPTVLKVSVGATIAFAMEISEFLVVTYTSSLTLSIAGIFKEMCILVLAVEVSGDQLSPVNVVGLPLCLLGIMGHIVHKVLLIRSVAGSVTAIDSEDFDSLGRTRVHHHKSKKEEHHEPLLEDQKWQSEESDVDTNVVLYEVLQRRDGR
ncbi:solute carrier family 35 member C2 [Pectinophora gossypiella]|uniref:Sugar phosphate transporter domain-containing protein n=1 Tax=Pectinophora gossypiella TaxID=13191 RepID=A0A1E1W192_PECGO|nr:solute carrier family 35 member C2 [Pectinophora gossypiella]